MRKSLKGFTLIECIVALAILGIASLTMAQIYANVSMRNRNNHLVNTSLSNQMAYVEKATGSEAVPIYFGGTTDTPDADASSTDRKPPHETSESTHNNYITIVRCKPDASDPSKINHVAGETYSFPADIYVLQSRDASSPSYEFGRDSDDPGYSGDNENDYNLRYKYIVGHKN